MLTLRSHIDTASIVKDIADRLRDPDRVKSIVSSPNNINPNPIDSQPQSWCDLPLAVGYPALLLLFSELALQFPEEKWDSAIFDYAKKIAACLQGQRIASFSLLTGLSGVCFSIQKASKNGIHFQKLLSTLNHHLIQAINIHYIQPLESNLQAGKPSSADLYDQILGISGIGVYLLEYQSNVQCYSTLEKIVSLLVQIASPLKINNKEVPGWYTPHELIVESKRHKTYGMCDIGLAHGVSGILGFLSTCLLHKMEIKGQKKAIHNIVKWLQTQRRSSEKGYFWKTVMYDDYSEVVKDKLEAFVGRDAWCYGTPGVSASLLLASQALQDNSLKKYALESFASVFRRSREEWYLPGPTMCHGISSLLLITGEFAKHEDKEFSFSEQEERLLQCLMGYYDPRFPFGFKEYELCQDGSYFQSDQVGLLNGVVGVLLTLLSYRNPKTSWWHAPFLISAGI